MSESWGVWCRAERPVRGVPDHWHVAADSPERFRGTQSEALLEAHRMNATERARTVAVRGAEDRVMGCEERCIAHPEYPAGQCEKCGDDAKTLAVELAREVNDLRTRLAASTAEVEELRKALLRHLETARPALKWVRNHSPLRSEDHGHAQIALDSVLAAIALLRGS